MEQNDINPKKILNGAGLSLFIFVLVILGASNAFVLLLKNYFIEITKTNWYQWVLNGVCIIGIGFPIYYFFMRKVPDSPKGEAIKMKPSRFIMIFFICAAAMYITNFISGILTVGIALLKGQKELYNPAVKAILNSNYLVSLAYASIVAPISEEIIFRKILLDKLRRFGDIPAIVMTGLAFGLFHMNLSQFFYAAVLGFIFAYITIQTNTVKYSILLHMIINFIGSAVTPLITGKNIIGIMIMAIWVIISITTGIVLFIVNIKKIKFNKSDLRMKTTDYFLNTGTILYTLACCTMIVFVTIFY